MPIIAGTSGPNRERFGTVKSEMVKPDKALLSANCELYIGAQGFDAGKLLNLIAAKHQANETSSGKWGKEIGMATARFCTSATSIWGCANNLPGMNDAVVKVRTNKRGDGAASPDHLTNIDQSLIAGAQFRQPVCIKLNGRFWERCPRIRQ